MEIPDYYYIKDDFYNFYKKEFNLTDFEIAQLRYFIVSRFIEVISRVRGVSVEDLYKPKEIIYGS